MISMDNNEKKYYADEWNVTRDFSNICDVNISRRTCNKIIFSCSEIKNQVYLCSGCELFFYCLLPFCCCSFSVVDVFPCSSLFFHSPCARSSVFPAKCILSSLSRSTRFYYFTKYISIQKIISTFFLSLVTSAVVGINYNRSQ